MVFDPQKGNAAIGADEPVRWFATDEYSLDNIPDDDINRGFKTLESALSKAQDSSAWGETVYVWPAGQYPGERAAYAVAIGSELYFRRNAQPTTEKRVIVELKASRSWLASQAMQGMLACGLLKESDGLTLAQYSVDVAEALIAALEEGN